VSREWGDTTTILFLAKNCWILKAVSAYSVFKKIPKHTCRHLEKMPEKLTQSTQCIVTWQSSSEYRRLTVPSGRTMNYVSFVWKILIPKIFGFPLVDTDSQLVCTVIPFVWKILIPEIFGFPLADTDSQLVCTVIPFVRKILIPEIFGFPS
jgi:hypothetical protein